MLGATTDKVKAQSMVEVDASRQFDEKAAGRTTSSSPRPRNCAKLDDLADSPDIPQFLAIAREAAERSLACAPSMFSFSARCG